MNTGRQKLLRAAFTATLPWCKRVGKLLHFTVVTNLPRKISRSSCEDINMDWIFSSFPQPGFLQSKRDGVTAATSALCHPAGTDWQSFNLVLTESYHKAGSSGLMVVRTNYGPLVLFSTYMLGVSVCTLDAWIWSNLYSYKYLIQWNSSYFQQ